MEKKNVVFLTVLAIATLLTAVVGTTFAYFTATVTGTGTTTNVTTATLSASYSDGAAISAPLIAPGWTASKTITISNSSNVALTYDVAWTSLTNFFEQGTVSGTDDFVYSLHCSSEHGATDITEAAVPKVDNTKLISDQSIAAGETQTYTLTLTFKNIDGVQNENQGKSFTATLAVSVANVTTQP